MSRAEPLFLQPPSLICAMGDDLASCTRRLFSTAQPDCLQRLDGYLPQGTAVLGALHRNLETLQQVPLPYRSRNNALLAALADALSAPIEDARRRHGAHRIAVVLGTSTSGIAETERAVFCPDAAGSYHYGQQEIGNGADFLRRFLRLQGPAYVVSTACSSAARAMIAGARLIRAGMVDAAVVGGADTLCRFTVRGFAALESVDAERCNPCSRHRRGINIGEGGALFLLGREPSPVRLAGCGETADAYHMSAPDPSGQGARQAMREALAQAGISAEQLDYINLHGTATPLNDAMEAAALAGIGAGAVPCSSTKPLTGHALGAAAAIEAAFCWATLADNPEALLPPHWYDGEFDPALAPIALVAPGQRATRPVRHALSNSFAFGGSNASLVFSAE